jgi:O-succinylbenzoate synthase
MAWWDLSARMQRRPLHQVIGGYRENIELSITLERMESLADFTEQARKAADAGFARIGMVFRPGWDLQILGCLREELPTHSLCANAGGTLRLENMETLHRLEDFNLSMVVQPLPADDLVGHAMLQEAIDTPIGLDEGIASPEQADMAIELKSCQCIDLQPGRLGGLTPAIAVHDLCQGADMPCWVGATPQSAIAARFGLAVAAKENCRFPAEHFPAEEWLETDVAASVETASIDDRRAASLWSEPGIGIEPDVNALEANQLNHATL